MSTLRFRIAFACLSVCGLCRAAASGVFQPPAFGHYEPILDRMPFGTPPANFDAQADPDAAKNAAQVQAEQQKLAKQINMSAVTITPGGQTAIGFSDLSAKPPANYFLLVGAEADGWKVLSADYDDEVATLEKDGVTITLKLGQGLVETPAAPPAAPAAPAGPVRPPTLPALAGRPPLPPGLARSPVAAPPAPVALPSYKERLLERATQQTEAQREAEKRQREQLERLAREAAQKEIERREVEAAGVEVQEAAQAEEAPAPEQPGAMHPAEGNAE